ncbi:phosphatidate cytidylyltransferase [Neurospora tetrasperma FGSC 2508]|uniref:Phosphatidate cytidylyltransferase n=3 Tax=Neurospora TaxID=5140 RepID=Q7S279_NEUCR|nr:phosphatidate cytidylyltransferase [Neurospora tetrasperma FGSC 2508]XP_958709.1 phosphatidate cytidylyltransferase [Neurospora crassa OR74A]EAA29473.1 phosphatidate cytidylyltransferase [Neurospora crassa OR74A]EGO58528.1 phosphatidate cytidylyltransferase [Neurospora tetrasperma FGSC 2508]EGZ72593.1 phosphatidate cytidylyltransferase [Neurospora tetrasperma FGSC 2509]|eukprot:XP_958709.1 phosphatidate cytidylyltransferase [Neurospora crassa OR74A]
MTGRSRRGVKFPHSGRRSSMSEASEESSPSKTRALANIQEKSKDAGDNQQLSDYEKKKANFIERTLWTFVMIAGFFAALFMGHIYIVVIITAVQIISFKEVIAISSGASRARDIQSTKSLNWYWLAVAMYFLHGETVIYYFKHIVMVDRVLLPLATHHRFICFTLYVVGFVFFVSTLKGGHLKFQFTQFVWAHMALFLIVGQSHFIMNNVFDGLIWFFLPAALVITNDIFAYVCGITFGRTQLIKLSPKKTVEGFLGAWVMTVLFGILLTHILMRSRFFICPANDLGANIFTGLDCEPNPVFIPQTWTMPELLFFPTKTRFSITMAPMQIHTFFWATFASLIAPFGGFFASGLKRTFKIKDFGHSIPGHGGITDRMDCQFIMGFFAYIYYHTFIAQSKVDFDEVLEIVATRLTIDDHKKLLLFIAKYLVNHNAIDSSIVNAIEKSLTNH